MALRVGLNGFGRIGRIFLRTCFVRSNIELLAINDPVIDIEYICYLIKFDSTHGKYINRITYSGNVITINGKNITVFHNKFPSSIPWHTLGVEYVVEASGMFSSMDKSSGHLISSSVKCVLVTTPSGDVPILILGVNEQLIKRDQRVISCASSTLYCLAPIVKILEDDYGISEGFVTCIHAMTPSSKPLDGMCLKGRHWRDHRSIHQNIIPSATGACKALGSIIPSVNDKFRGLAFRVPIMNVSVLDITVRLNNSTSIQDIAARIEKEGKLRNVISTSYDEAVSSDFMNDEHSCILDVNASLQLTPTYFKLICWYDNEYSYACRVIDTILFLHELFTSQVPSISFEPIKPRSDTVCFTSKKQDIIKHCKSKKIYYTMSLGSGFKDHLNKTTNVQQTTKEADSHSKLYKSDENINEEKTTKITVYDSICNTNIKQGIYGQISNTTENREKLELAKKELAKITSKTEDLLKESNRDKVMEMLNTSILVPSSTSNNANYTIDNNIRTLDELKNKENRTDRNINVNNNNSNFNISFEIIENKNITIENIPEDITVDEENVEVDTKSKDICLHNFKASIIISDKNGKENTIVSIAEKSNQHVNVKNINKTSRSHEHFNYGQYISITSEETDVVLPSAFKNKRFDTMTNKANTNDKHNERHPDKNILLVPSASLDSKEMCENRQTKNQVIKEKILSSVLKTSQGDMSHSLKISKGDNLTCIAKENLLDKLNSETDSDFSFRIDEAKSQVIDITDLSSSTDDLARLDKICRIIEISDELSDELFSTLNVNSQSDKKEWSFKELCEKIKLDDFCRKVFGQ